MEVFPLLIYWWLTFTDNNYKMFDEFKWAMSRELEISDNGLISSYLSIKGKQCVDRILYHKNLMQARCLRILACRKASQWTPRFTSGEKLSKLEEGQRVKSIHYRIIVESLRFWSAPGLIFFKELDFTYCSALVCFSQAISYDQYDECGFWFFCWIELA